MAVAPKLSDAEIAGLMEIPHPSKALGESIYGATKVFGERQAEARRDLPWDGRRDHARVVAEPAGRAGCRAPRFRRGAARSRNTLKRSLSEGGTLYACRLGLSLHGAREEGVIPCHPLDTQDAMTEDARKGAIINTTRAF